MQILIVDDDAAIVESIRDMIHWEKLGIEKVKTALSADRARRLLEEEETDIVISDIEMPGESGLSLLQWYREKQMRGKFLLLTSHESFQYAAEAIKLHAEEYLLKPFSAEMMELVLQKMIAQIKAEREKERQREYETLGQSQIFLTRLLSGQISGAPDQLRREIEGRGVSLRPDGVYRLVVSRITNMEQDIEEYGRGLFQFIFENMHSEILIGTPENERVVYFERGDYWLFAAVCEDAPSEGIKAVCEEEISRIGKLLNCTMTTCVSDPCQAADLCEAFQRVEYKLEQNIVCYGKAFLESEFEENAAEHRPVLELKRMEEILNRRNRREFMNYLKRELNALAGMNALDSARMRNIRREVQQAVYAYLAERGILITLVEKDDDSLRISQRAERSVTDMIRWVNYLLTLTFDYEEEVQKSSGIIHRIQMFIREHYKENIGRNEIGAEFFLVPEYLAKMYKKKTGQTLKDYINECRLEQARQLLANTQMKISDVAAEVGFDNFSYFSTLFKKHTGMTPNEYRQQL